MKQRYRLTISCKDRPGIVAAVTTCLAAHGCNIVEAQQFDDLLKARFFMRIEFDAKSAANVDFRNGINMLARELDLDWRLRAASPPKRVLLLVSRFDHCMADLLYRRTIGELDMDLVGIISNYPKQTFAHLGLGFRGVPFHFLPIVEGAKAEQEAHIRDIVTTTEPELIVLARYMQILSDELVQFLRGRCINIHHSFLPGFKGGRPYHQAHARGVKIIGATAHFVTTELDEGPIIEQDVERVTHRDTPADLIRKGRDIERRVLSRAVRAFLEDRILENGRRTVVFT